MTKPSDRPVAIVTGSASGIGAATAARLAAAGLNITVNFGHNEEGAGKTASTCREAGVEAIVARADVTVDADCRKLVDATVAQWGRLDVLVNNAGTTKFVNQRNLEGLTSEDFDRIMRVNLTGAYQMARAAHPHLKASPLASVVNISSHSGFTGIGSSIAYAASKGALNTLTLSLARTLAPEVRVNAVCPGFVDTQWFAKSGKFDIGRMAVFRSKMKEGAPLKRLTRAEDVAETVAFLALSAKAVTGVLLIVDGGVHLTVGSPL